MTTTVPAELKRLYRQGRVIPFIGAGVSMSVKWSTGSGKTTQGPSWSEMVDEACHQLGYRDPELLRYRGTDLQILEFFAQKKGNFAPLTNWMVRRFTVPDEALKASAVHNALAQLDEASKYYTTNYDDLVERSLSLHGRTVRVIATERDMAQSDTMTEVVKFHGDFDHPDEMVLSEVHYHNRLRLDCPIDLKLRSDLLNRVAFFIGYSFRDMNIGLLFHRINEMLKMLPDSDTGRRAFIVVNNPSDFEYTIFRQRNIEIVPTYGDDKTSSLTQILTELAS